MHPLKKILEGRSKQQSGVFSACTANELALRAALRHAKQHNYVAVIEATANQVNQFGGYTDMLPAQYAEMVRKIARQEALSNDQLILGGDHLGPLTWQSLPEAEAMANSRELVRQYTLAGFTKIHLDTSMRVADDDQNAPLDVAVCARRGAQLAKEVLAAYEVLRLTQPEATRPVLVIGSEVPIPGGSQEHEDSVQPTAPAEFCRQYEIFRKTFENAGIPFEDVVAFVVQPGVEFGDDFACQYQSDNASTLTDALKNYAPLVFEGHSTDYQTPESLTGMVNDGIRILKVGPALTFALREALQALEDCEKLLIPEENRSGFEAALLAEMDASDRYWKKYYFGTEEEIAYKKLYSYSDRCRYYLPGQAVEQAVARLLENTKHIPIALVSRFFPQQFTKVQRGELDNDGQSLVLDRVGIWCGIYAAACGVNE